MTTRSRLLTIGSLISTLRSATRPGAPSLGARAGAVPRMLRAFLAGEYRGITMGRLVAMAGAIAYVVAPVDLVPEALLLAFGLVDDALVLSWLAAALISSTDDYLAWEGIPAGSRPYAASPAPGTYGSVIPTPVARPDVQDAPGRGSAPGL